MKVKTIFVWLIILFTANLIRGQCNDFVRIDGKKFKCGGNDFFAVACNYGVEMRYVTGAQSPVTPLNFFAGRFHPYYPHNTSYPYSVNVYQSYQLIRNDFRIMESKGINTVRVYGGLEYNGIGFKPFDEFENPLSYQITPSNAGSGTLADFNGLYLAALDSLLNAAQLAHLKIIFLAGSPNFASSNTSSEIKQRYVDYLGELAQRFKYNSALLAVEFMNEPNNSFPGEAKHNVCAMTKTWHNAIKQNSQILTTIGPSGTDMAFDWDPAFLNVDFLSIHNYPTATNPTTKYQTDLTDAINRVKSDYYWLQNYCPLPWIVGETGMSAHPYNISHPINNGCLRDVGNAGTLSDQATYLAETIKACKDYGGAGYAWWAFMDEHVGGSLPPTQSNAYNGCDISSTAFNEAGGPYWGLWRSHDGNLSNQYVYKTAVQVIDDFDPSLPATNSGTPANYYNYRNIPSVNYASGVVRDASNNYSPIPGAIIMAINDPNVGIWGMTYSNANGEYTVCSYQPIHTIRWTASGYDAQVINNINLQNSNVILGQDLYLSKAPSYPAYQTLNYSNNQIYNANVDAYAIVDVNFSNNYNIYSGNFNVTAGSVIHLNSGFSAKSGSNFKARIGKYQYDCTAFSFRSNPQPTSINPNISLTNTFELYPNPGNGKYTFIGTANEKYELKIYNIQGSLMRSTFVDEKEQEINIENLANGIYFFNIKTSSGETSNIKVIKQ